MSIFQSIVASAHSALELLATALTPIAGGVAGALAIISFTMLVRLLISPLTYLQARAERRRAKLAPQIAVLRTRHASDPLQLATETLALQRAAGVGPFVTLLPGLAQAPFFMLMYQLVQPGAGLLAGAVFGVPLTAHVLAGWPVFSVLIVVALGLAWLSSRRMRLASTGELAGIARVMPLLPYLTVLMIAYLPLAGGLYLVTSTAWTALEHTAWRRPAPSLT